MPSTTLIESFRIDLRRFERAIAQLNKSHCCLGINVPQCHTIMEIGLAESLTLKALAQKMDLDKSTVSRQIDNLVKADLVKREIPVSDRRKVQITLSAQGKEIYREMNAAINERFQAAFEGIAAEDMEVFRQVFEQLSIRLIG